MAGVNTDPLSAKDTGFNLFNVFNFFAPPTQAATDPNYTVDAAPEFTPGLDLATAPQPTFKQLELFLNVYDNMREKARVQKEENAEYGLNETDLIDQYQQFQAHDLFDDYMKPLALRLDRMDLVEDLPVEFNGNDAEGIRQTVDEIYGQIEIEDRDQYLAISGLATPTMTPTLSKAQIDSFMTATSDVADGVHSDVVNVAPAILVARPASLDIARQHAAAEKMSIEATDAFIAAYETGREEIITELQNMDAPVIPSVAEIAAVDIYRDMDASTDLAIADAAGVDRDVYVASLGPNAEIPADTIDVTTAIEAAPEVEVPVLPEVVHIAQAAPAEEAAQNIAASVEEPETTELEETVEEPAPAEPAPAEPAAPQFAMVAVQSGDSLWQMVADQYGMEDAPHADIMKRIEEIAAIPENAQLLEDNAKRAGRPNEVSAHYLYPGQEFKFPTEAALAAGPQNAPDLNWRSLDREWMPGMTPVGP